MRLGVLCILLVFGVDVWAGEAQESRLVQISSGPVRGYKNTDYDLYEFYGIPYATAPTGEHRFKAPLPAPVWFQPFEAVVTGIACPQYITPLFKDLVKNMKEDCLIANVLVPDTDEINLPVVVNVHGGGYQMGSGDLMQLKNLVKSKKIIVVTFNYRLGVHGFLCLGTEGVPGNAGMKDQVALLRWVKENIANFGGNPDDVTIEGGSAGSSAVDLLMLSPATRGLFNKVIPESGSNMASWSVQIDPLQYAKDHAKLLNFTNVDDVYELEKFYQTSSFGTLISDYFLYRIDSVFGFSPCVERDTGEEKFLDDAPINILKQGKYNKLPMLYGFANMEGLMRVNMGYEVFKDKMNEKFSDFLPGDLHFDNEKQKEAVAQQVKEFYFEDKPVGDDTILGYINFFSDVTFTYSTLRSVELQVKAGNDKIYLYEYSFVDEKAPSLVLPQFKTLGADHCGQTAAIMDGYMVLAKDDNELSEEYRKMKAVIRELWLNFIITGSPVPEGSSLPAWPPTDASGNPHMSLDRTLELRGPLLARRKRFWDDIYRKHYRTPIPPPTPKKRHTHHDL